jgi:hypothetical protein
MRWTGKVEPKSTCDTPITSVDFLPTFARLGGQGLDGFSDHGSADPHLVTQRPFLGQRLARFHFASQNPASQVVDDLTAEISTRSTSFHVPVLAPIDGRIVLQ